MRSKGENEPRLQHSSAFRIGQRVKLTAYAKSCGIRLQSRANDSGTVIALDGALSIKVRPDGYKQAYSYSAAFWEAAKLDARNKG